MDEKIRSRLQSTKTDVKKEEKALQHEPKLTNTMAYHQVYDLNNDLELKMYTNQTGRFPVKLYKGMQYIMVLYKTSSNAIFVQGMKIKLLAKWSLHA